VVFVFCDIYKQKMNKYQLKETIKQGLIKELDGIMSNQEKMTRKQALQAILKDLKQRQIDTQNELNSIR
jgi:hypothetical protein